MKYYLSIGISHLLAIQYDRDTFRKLVDENREYIRSGDEWFHIDPLWLRKIRDLMDRADAGEWTVKDLLFQDVPEEIVPLERGRRYR